MAETRSAQVEKLRPGRLRRKRRRTTYGQKQTRRDSKLEGQADTESTEIQLENKGTVKVRIRAIEQQKGKKNDVWIEED